MTVMDFEFYFAKAFKTMEDMSTDAEEKLKTNNTGINSINSSHFPGLPGI